MKNKLFALVIISLIFSCQKVSISTTEICIDDLSFLTNENHPKAEQIERAVDDYISKGLPGATVLIKDHDGFWIKSFGMADIEAGIKMEPCHINKLGSITKMMMGALVWQLVQDGKLDIKQKIQTYIPEIAKDIENGDEITLGMLLNHTSGIYDIAIDLGYNFAVINDMTKSWEEKDILKYIKGKPASNLPGKEVNYSNSNTLLIGLIIESVSDQTHGELLKSKIFEPLGMDHTVYYDYSSNFPYKNLAQGYLDLNNDGGSIQNISNLNPGSGNGYTGVYSTVTDLYTFMSALMNGSRLINDANKEFILNNMVLKTDGAWASSYGAIHNERRHLLPEGKNAYGHAGGDIGYSANLTYFPENNTFFAATYNYGTNLPSKLGNELEKLRQELYLIMAR